MIRFRNVAALVAFASCAAASAGVPFTYQGRLRQDGQPFNGAANLTFSIYDGATGEGFIGDEVHNNVPITNGLFTVELNNDNSWGNQFSGTIWLEVAVNGNTLAPRQKITAAPRAINAESITLPYDTGDNFYNGSSPAFRMFNHASGGAIWAGSASGAGNAVVGDNQGTTGGGSGVLGTTRAPEGFSVAGIQQATSGSSIAGFFTSPSPTGFGVLGRVLHTGAANGSYAGEFENYATSGFATGVQGMSFSNNNGFGVRGVHLANNGFGAGVYGLSTSPQGVAGYFHNNAGGVALRAFGLSQVDVLQIMGGSDLSEGFDIGGADISPGAVVSIDATQPGKLIASNRAYDKKVAGIISGAGGVKVGMIMGQSGTIADGKHPVALTGRVYCKAIGGATGIEPGDLLTTSNVVGHAMKVGDHHAAQGAIIGKAMTVLKAGETGLVLVLVNLQ